MRIHEDVSADKGTFRKVATGLYRFSTSGVYFAHVRIHGKLFRKSLKTADRQLAGRKLGDFRRSQSRVDHRFSRTTLADLTERYAQTIQRLSPRSITTKRNILKRLRDDWPQGEQVLLSNIKTSDCEIWLSKQAKHVGPSHLNAFLTVLRDALQLAVRDGMISDHPCAHLKYAKRERPIRQTPTWEEFKAIVNDIRDQPFNADARDSANFVEFIGLAGLGRAEAGALTWPDVDFDRGVMTTFRHKTRTGFMVPIYPQLRPLLVRLHAERLAGEERVFRIKDAKKAIAGACRRLKLAAYSHRAFRRMFITRAIEKGIDVKVIAEWQGHRDGGKLILDTYSHVNRTHSNRMAQLLGTDEPENVIPMTAKQRVKSSAKQRKWIAPSNAVTTKTKHGSSCKRRWPTLESVRAAKMTRDCTEN
jgi:integrase